MKIKIKELFSYFIIIAMALLLAANYYIFIIENKFAPAGLNGIATMIQYKTGISISYVSLIINIPLCIVSSFIIEHKFAVKTLLFTLVYSFSFLALQRINPAYLQYDAAGHDTVFPVIISGVLSGVVYGFCFKNNSCTGGTDIISKILNKRNPNFNFFTVTFTLNALVAAISLFVYADEGNINYKPVALCIAYCFISTFMGNYIIRGYKSAYKFTVITTHPNEIIAEITTVLKHSATKIEAVGGYSDQSKTVLICVVNKHQLNDFRKIIDNFADTFSFCETVSETYGNFKHIK